MIIKLLQRLLIIFTITFNSVLADDNDNILKIKQLLYKANNQKLFFKTETIKLANEALNLSLKIEEKQQVIESYILLGEVLRLFNYHTASIEAFQTAYKYSVENEYHFLDNQIFLEMAETYRASQLYEEAIKCIKKSVVLSKEKKEQFITAKAYNRYATILFEYSYQAKNTFINKSKDANFVLYKKDSYVAKKNLEKVLLYIDSSNTCINKNNIAFKRIELSNYNIKAATYTFLQKYNFAQLFYEKAIILGEELDDLIELPIIYINYSNFLHQKKEYKKAIEFGKKAYLMSKKNKIIFYEMYSSQILFTTFRDLNNIKESLKYLLIKDSLMNQINADRMQTQAYFLNLKYDEIKESENIKSQSKLIVYQYILIGMAIIFVLIITFLYHKKQKNQKKINKDLAEKNYVITIQKEQLEKSIASRNKLFTILSHDMRSPFLGLTGFADLLYDEYSTLPEEEKKHIVYEMRNSIKKIFQQINDMFEWAKLQIGFYEYMPKNIDLFNSIVLTMNVFSGNTIKKSIKVLNLVKPNTYIFADQNMVNSILRNLISNAIKFSPKNSEIIIKLIEKNEYYEVIIEDKGVGIEQDQIDDIFNANKINTTIGTDGEVGNGLGLIIVKEMVEMNEGKIWVESEINKGTKFIFTLKKGIMK